MTSSVASGKLYENTVVEDTRPPNATDDEVQDFKNKVSEWVKIDEQIRKLQIAIKERRVHKKVLGAKIQEFMTKNGYDNLNTQQGVIKSSVREAHVPIRLSEVKMKLTAISEENVQFKEAITKIFNEERPLVVKSSLKRIIPKVNNVLSI